MRRLHGLVFVTDMARSVSFYRTLLQREPTYQSEHWTEFEVGGARLGLHTWDGQGSSAGAGTVRLFFEVEDIEAEKARLERAGVRLRGQIVDLEGAGRDLLFEDPDGHVLELWQPPETVSR